MTTSTGDLDGLLHHADWLRALAVRLAGHPRDAEDVVQETYLVALEKKPPADGRPIRPWLKEVLRNVIRQRHRSESRRESREQQARTGDGAAAAAAEAAEQAELYQALSSEVKELDEPFRTAIVMRYFQGKSPYEIAEQLDVSFNTVTTRLERGRQRLRERLDGRYEDRKSWCALVVPLAGRVAPVAPVAAASLPAFSVPVLVVAAAVLASIAFWPEPEDGADGPGPARAVAADVSEPSPTGTSTTTRAEADVVDRRLLTSAESTTSRGSVVVGRVIVKGGGLPAVDSIVELDVGGGDAGVPRSLPLIRTDVEGRFQANLGSYVPSDSAVSLLVRANTPGASDGRLIRGNSHVAKFDFNVMASAQRRPDGVLDLGDILVDPGVFLSGTVVADGIPVPGALFFVASSTTGPGPMPKNFCLHVGTSKTDGTYHLNEPISTMTGTDSGRLILMVVADGRLASWQPLNVTVGQQQLTVPIELRHGRLVVFVKDRHDRPVPGASVSLTPRLDERRAPPGGPDLRAMHGLSGFLGGLDGVTALDGSVAFPMLPAGRQPVTYHVVVSYPTLGGESRTIAIESGRSARVDIVLPDSDEMTGVIVDGSGEPIDGADVRWNMARVTRSNLAGRFTVEIDGSQSLAMLRIEREGYATRGWRLESPKALRGGPDFEVVLDRSMPISLWLVDAHGQPVTGLRPELRQGRDLTLMPTSSTAETARFHFGDAGPGTYLVKIQPTTPDGMGDWILPAERFVRGGVRDVPITIERLHPWQADLSIGIRDAGTGTPLTPTSARIYGRKRLDGGHRFASVEFVSGVVRGVGHVEAMSVCAGRYGLAVEFEDRPRAFHTFEIVPGIVPGEMTLRVGLGATVVGTIAGLDGAEVGPETEITLVPDGFDGLEFERFNAPWKIDRDGADPRRFRIEGVPAGRFVLRVRTASGDEATTTIDVPVAGELEVTVDL